MRFRIATALAVFVLGASSATARAEGPWTTYLRAGDFTDLLATPTDVWAATSDAGLLRLVRAANRVDVIRREPGSIASNALTSIAMDGRGRLWLGTRGFGASRRNEDGSRWDLVNRLDGLPTDTVSVVEATGDTVWIGTTQGIALWNGVEVSGSLPDGNTASFDTTFRRPGIVGIAVLGDSVWLATRTDVGFARISNGLSDWRRFSTGIGGAEPLALASDGTTLLVYTSAGGVASLSPGDNQWLFRGTGAAVHNLVDDNGVVLVADELGIARWNGGGWDRIPGARGSLTTDADDPEPTIDPAGRLFIGVPDSLLEQPDGAAPWIARAAPASMPWNDLFTLALDGPRLYVTTNGAGVARLDASGWRHWPRQPCSGNGCDTTFWNPSSPIGLLVDRVGRKWVGTWSQSIDSFDDSVSPPSFTHHFTPPHLSVDSLKHTFMISGAADLVGNRWIGLDTRERETLTPIGLDLYDASGAFVANYNPSNSQMAGFFVRALAVSDRNRVWIGYSNQGVDFFTPTSTGAGGFSRLSNTSGLDVHGIAVRDDSLWVLTPSDLRRYSSQTATFRESYSVTGGQNDLAIHPLAVARDGTVWVATGAGVRAYRPGGGAPDVFTTANSPLTSDAARSVVVEPDGKVWIATASGLNRYDPHFVAPDQNLATLAIRVYPNPIVLTGAGLQLRLLGDASSYEGEILDLAGRRVRRFAVPANGRVFWDGRDQSGGLVQPGIYFVRARAGGREAVARIALLR